MTLRSKSLAVIIVLVGMWIMLRRVPPHENPATSARAFATPAAQSMAPRVPEPQAPTSDDHPADLRKEWAEPIQNVRAVFPQLKLLDQNIQRGIFMHDAFNRLEADPIHRQLAITTLTKPGAASAFFGEDQGYARVFFIEYLAYVDRKDPATDLIPLAIRLLSQGKIMQKGQEEDIEELLYYYLIRRLDELLKDPVPVLNTLDINAYNSSIFSRAFGPIMAKISDAQKSEVMEYFRRKNIMRSSFSSE